MASPESISQLLTSFGDPFTAVTIIALAVPAAVFLLALYRVSPLHALSQHPGPLLWRTSRVPYVYYYLSGRLPTKVHELHEKYGPIVRIAPNELSFTDGRAWENLQGLLPERKQNPKDLTAFGPYEQGNDKHIIMGGDKVHARLRRVFNPAFTTKAIGEQSATLVKYANLLVAALKKRTTQGQPVQNMSDWFNFTTFDLTGEFAFGEPFDCLTTGSYHFFVSIVMEAMISGGLAGQVDRWGLFSMIRPFIGKKLLKVRYQLEDYVTTVVDKRLQKGYDPHVRDLFNYLLDSKNEQLERTEMIQNAVTLVMAGSETTASTLTGAVWLLCANPKIMQKVKKEVRDLFKRDPDITKKATDDLPYMHACLKEAMRIFPATAFGWARRIITPGGQVIAGTHIPQNTYCSVSHYAAYRSSANYAQPDEFIPERWLRDNSKPGIFKNDSKDAFEPFHRGPRGCIGKTFAHAEMRIIMAKLLFNFDMELAEPEKDWIEGLRAFSIWERKPLNIKVDSRG